MPAAHYRLLLVAAASLSLTLAACGSDKTAEDAPATGEQTAASTDSAPPDPAASDHDGINTDSTIWTMLGLADKPNDHPTGPQTGDTVSPVLWRAAHDSLKFVPIVSENPSTGSIVTDWYSPPDKPNERYRVDVFIMSRALRSDSMALTVEREAREPGGKWTVTTVDREVANNLETAILQRAREIRRAQPAPS